MKAFCNMCGVLGTISPLLNPNNQINNQNKHAFLHANYTFIPTEYMGLNMG